MYMLGLQPGFADIPNDRHFQAMMQMLFEELSNVFNWQI